MNDPGPAGGTLENGFHMRASREQAHAGGSRVGIPVGHHGRGDFWKSENSFRERIWG